MCSFWKQSYSLIDWRRKNLSGIVSAINGERIHGRQQTFDLWGEYFEKQFSTARANVVTPMNTTANPWDWFLDPKGK